MVKKFDFLKEDDRFYYDEEAVGRVVRFIETFCKLSKEHRGQPFKLFPWQLEIISDVFGWKWKDSGLRRFRNVYIEVPRKNGKTEFAAALALYLLIADGTSGAEVYAAALTTDQSGLLFKSVLSMVDQSEFLSEKLRTIPYKKEGYHDKSGSKLKALSGEASGKHGFYPSAVICDELHEWEGESAEYLYEALTTGFGARKNPLVIHITTAGFGGNQTLAKKYHETAERFSEGTLDDPTFYGVCYGADLEDDWASEETWKKANPSYELRKDNLKTEYLQAKSDTSKENSFKRLFLNIWTQQQTRWLDMAKWNNCVPKEKPIKPDDFKGQDCILGLDLGSVYDLTAIAKIYPKDKTNWKVFTNAYMPRQQIERRTKEDAISYEKWSKKGWITATDGTSNGLTTDYSRITEEVRKICRENNVVCVGYDPSYGAQFVIEELEKDGIYCMNVGQNFKEMGPASVELETRLFSRQITIEDNPCLHWQAGNVEVAFDSNGAIRPAKPNARGKYAGSAKYKIDSVVAIVIATQTILLTYRPEEKEPEKPKVGVFFVKR